MSVLPFIELRGGLPVAVDYALKNNLSIMPIFLVIFLANVLVIFFLFFVFDYLNSTLLKLGFYKRFFNFWLERTRRKAEKVEKRMKIWGFVALMGFVAIPLPLTGAWTGTFIAWILGLERKKSILAISLGVLIAGIIILFASLSILSFFR